MTYVVDDHDRPLRRLRDDEIVDAEGVRAHVCETVGAEANLIDCVPLVFVLFSFFLVCFLPPSDLWVGRSG